MRSPQRPPEPVHYAKDALTSSYMTEYTPHKIEPRAAPAGSFGGTDLHPSLPFDGQTTQRRDYTPHKIEPRSPHAQGLVGAQVMLRSSRRVLGFDSARGSSSIAQRLTHRQQPPAPDGVWRHSPAGALNGGTGPSEGRVCTLSRRQEDWLAPTYVPRQCVGDACNSMHYGWVLTAWVLKDGCPAGVCNEAAFLGRDDPPGRVWHQGTAPPTPSTP